MNYVRKIPLLILSSCFLFGLSCSKEKQEITPKNEVVNHTVIVYMIANNDLHNEAIENINQMESAWKKNFDGNLIVVFEPRSTTKEFYMIEIEEDHNLDVIKSSIVESYYNNDAFNPEVMKFLLQKITAQYPSKHYSLILWSHGS